MLDDGIRQMELADAARLAKSSDDAKGLLATIGETGDISRMQRRLYLQCLAVRMYYRKLAERNRRKIANCKMTAAAVDAVMAMEADMAFDETDGTVVLDLLEEMDDAAGNTAHAIAHEVGRVFDRCGATTRRWAAEFAKEETFARASNIPGERRRGNFVGSTTASRSTFTRTCWRRSITSTSNGYDASRERRGST